jgi:hypothetical protein
MLWRANRCAPTDNNGIKKPWRCRAAAVNGLTPLGHQPPLGDGAAAPSGALRAI